jgi:hypothetical protein
MPPVYHRCGKAVEITGRRSSAHNEYFGTPSSSSAAGLGNGDWTE